MDLDEARNIARKALSSPDRERFDLLISEMEKESVSSAQFAEFNKEFKDILDNNNLQIFVSYSKENRFNSMNSIVVHKGEILK